MTKLKHKIFELLLRDLKLSKQERNPALSEEYTLDCLNTCDNIFTSIEKLKIAEEYVHLSANCIPSEKGSEIGSYVEYHIENYIIRSRTIYDRTLIFTNHLCDIGMSKEFIEHNSIITNQKVINSGLKSYLKAIRKACSKYRDERNSIIHHDRYKHENLEWVTVANQVASALGKDYEEILGISQETLIQNTAAVIWEHRTKFSSSTEIIVSQVNTFLDQAFEVYDAKTKF